jgi:hypothetical protein
MPSCSTPPAPPIALQILQIEITPMSSAVRTATPTELILCIHLRVRKLPTVVAFKNLICVFDIREQPLNQVIFSFSKLDTKNEELCV